MTQYVTAYADDGFNVQVLGENDILRVLNEAYIAKRFFGKSTSWFSQKINHHIKNGKSDDFTPEDV